MSRERDIDGLAEQAPRSMGPVVIIVLIATLAGSSLGILIADETELPFLKTKNASMFSTDHGSLLANLKAAILSIVGQNDEGSQEDAALDVIKTGLSSVGAIHYSPRAESTQMTFDLADMELIKTGRLVSPHRVYVDLKYIHWEPDSFKGIKTLKALDINGDLVSRVRIKKRELGVTRIVLDLKQCCDFTYQIPEGSSSRLIVRLQPV